MKENKGVFEFYESRSVSGIGMLASVLFLILGFVQPGPVKEPLNIVIVGSVFPVILFVFFYNLGKRPFILIDSEKIIIQKKTFYFSNIDTIFFYTETGPGCHPNQEILYIRIKGENYSRTSLIIRPPNSFVLTFMTYYERYLLEQRLCLLNKVRIMHLPPQHGKLDLPQLDIPPDI